MQANTFYSVQEKIAYPLFIVSAKQWLENDFDASPDERFFLKAQQFTGNAGEVAIIHNAEGITKVFIGGDQAKDFVLAQAVTNIPAGSYQLQNRVSSFALLNWSLAQYRFDRYKKNDVPPRVLQLRETELVGVLAQANAVFLTRDLINTPANDLGPSELAEVCARLASDCNAQFHQWVGDELLEHNFPAIHAVGRAAADAPRLLQLVWGNPKHPRLALVGKGVCFDSGGLDLKPASGMRFMKKDMGGAANALGLAQWIMQQKLPVHLQVYIPAIENAVGSRAFRPGDVITMRNKRTVEVDNTDAEGRLVLADALVKALEDKPSLLIDFATLTGAARVAVGTEIAAMFCNDDATTKAVLSAAQEVGDPVWQLPLFTNYETALESSIADLANSSSTPYAGAITAALFLQQFIDASVAWVHLDIMAWNPSSKPGKPEGGEAMAIRAIYRMLESWVQ